MEEGKQIKLRTAVLLLFFFTILALFFCVLYSIQIVHGASYLERASYSVVQTETVDSSRGEIMDSYGRMLISNRTQYQVTLDTSLMGANRGTILSSLLELCRQEEVTWTDTLPISFYQPYQYTTLNAKRTSVIWLRQLCEKLKIDAGEVVVTPAVIDPETEEVLTPETSAWVPAMPAWNLVDQLTAKLGALPDGLSNREKRELLGVLYELALRQREVTYSSYVFASDVDIRFITLVKEAGLVGVRIDPASTRQYHTTYASHILGRVGAVTPEQWKGDPDRGVTGYKDTPGYYLNSIVGQNGAELAFEPLLHGMGATREIETDSTGKLITSSWRGDAPQAGGNVMLTLDLSLQSYVEDRVATHIDSLDESGRAAAVVVDMTGGVLAMVSYPSYDLTQFYDTEYYNSLVEDPLRPMVNYATQGLYAPGSIFKPCVAIAGLETGTITTTQTILDTGYYDYFTHDPRHSPRCWIYAQSGGTHGLQTVTSAIRNSCNVFFYDLGRRVGIDKLVEYAHMFGLGVPTGIEIPEYVGNVAGPETSEKLHTQWYPGSITSAAIGQENNQFTPLQLANYLATLVNGGTHYAAHLLKSVKSPDYSEVLYEYEPQVLDEINIDPTNLAAVKLGMYQVTQTASVARYFNSLPVKAGAKTGTAQINNNTGTNATFVCFAPYDDPQIALCLVVEKGTSGSSLASMAADILQFYFTNQVADSAVTVENQLMR